jgi:F-type H+-transporting ATPase subunit b
MSKQRLFAWALIAGILLATAPSRALAFAEQEHAPAAKTDSAEHGGAGQEAPAGQPNILEFQLPLAFWTLVVFVVLLYVLYKFAWGPLSKALHDREHNMEQTLEQAEHARRESEKLLAEHRAQMAAAAEQARSILDDARRAAQTTGNDIVQKAQAEAEASRVRAERDIGNARDQALQEIWSKTADLAVSVAGKVLSRELSPDDQRRLVEVAMSELPSKSGNGSHAS